MILSVDAKPQVAVGMKGSLESAVHTVRTNIDRHNSSEDFCCFKVDMTNAVFNECSRTTFLKRIDKEFPELMGWVQWSYHTKGDLRFGNHRIVASAGVQQGDPLDSFLFSLVII